MDEEGMVYSLDDGARTVYFCDRFRRYKFVGEAGALALLQGMCTKNDANLEANASLFSKVRFHTTRRVHTVAASGREYASRDAYFGTIIGH